MYAPWTSDTLKNGDAFGFGKQGKKKKQESMETILRCGEWINEREREQRDGED